MAIAPCTAHAARATRSCSRTIRTGRTSSSFYEYFNGETGEGLGASHQTGWTGLVANRDRRVAEVRSQRPLPLAGEGGRRPGEGPHPPSAPSPRVAGRRL